MQPLFRIQSSKLVMLIVTFIVIIIIIAIFMILVKKNIKGNEGFTSGFRQMYRPHVRNARLIVEGYYNKTKNYFHVLLKKFGIV
jgi:hypothetical protein